MSIQEAPQELGIVLPFVREVVTPGQIEILHSDPSIVVINKPAGIPMNPNFLHPQGITEMMREMGGPDMSPVHRLDMDTSGVLVLGRTRNVRAILHRQFEKRRVTKTYLALVTGQWRRTLSGIIAPLLVDDKTVTVSDDGAAKSAATGFRQIGTYADSNGGRYSLLSVNIFTGRMHQIRAHLSHLGLPIAGDKKYNPDDSSDFPRQMLHSSRLTLIHPTTKRPMTFHAPYPSDFPKGIQPVVA